MTRRARSLAVLASIGLAVAAEGATTTEFPPVVPPPDVVAILPVAAPVAESPSVVPTPDVVAIVPAAVAEVTELPAVQLTVPAAQPTPRVLYSFPQMPQPAGGWFAAEALCWKVTGQQLPPLVTISPAGTPRATAGVLGTTGTRTVLDGEDLDGPRAGLRFSGGLFLDREHFSAIEFSAFVLDAESTDRPFQSSGDPILARPLYNVVANAQVSKLIAFPNLTSGSILAHTESHVWGFEANARQVLSTGDGATIECLAGYRFLRLSDSVAIQEVETVNGPSALPVGTVLAFGDQFDARNTFNGGQVGLAAHLERGAWTWSGSAKVAVGNMNQVVDIAGQSVFTSPGGTPVGVSSGLLALSSNIGHKSRNRCAVLPELGLGAACCVSSHLRLTAGYTALFLPNVVRAGEQIDLGNNPALFPPALPTGGPRRPAFLGFPSSDAWIQGISLGATLSW